ncbi:Avr1 secreted RxLR effector peptide protein [Phytophthora palmivora]|uniref:RxLR effector protein n=1 Tax=Phytophthora palmivora TaxID=4796 RepID=A0A2P4XLI2_9STRA|nr:Avr1 secreted RxLR effector peptide protein [Phytophthora palmivora]
MGLMTRSLLLAVFVLLTTVGTLTMATENTQIKISNVASPIAAISTRLLRNAKSVDDDVTDSEDRGLQSFISSLLSTRQINSWIKAGKTDDFVMNTLGLTGLTGEKLKNNPNFKKFQAFQVGRWLKENTPTSSVLEKLKLNELDYAALITADGYNTYVKYVFDLGKRANKYNIEDWPTLFGTGTIEQLKHRAGLLRWVHNEDLDMFMASTIRTIEQLKHRAGLLRWVHNEDLDMFMASTIRSQQVL